MSATTHTYTGRRTNWTGVVVSAILVVPLILLAPAGAEGTVDTVVLLTGALILLGVLAEVVTASDVRAACGPRGVSIHWGLLGWPRMSYALDEIAEASVVHVSWWSVSFGLWWTPRHTVCTVRSGPALRLRLRSGRKITVSVPDPHAALAALREAGLS